MIRIISAVTTFCLLVSACSDSTPQSVDSQPPWVRTQAVQVENRSALSLSGTVRGRYEIPVAFQVSGRIALRAVDAGQQVGAGQVLFQLDPRDLQEDLHAREAEQAAAQTALDIASADHVRNRELMAKKFISAQTLERSELSVREARTRLDAAKARARQARNMLGYATLKADAAGVLIEVNGDPGQVVAAGQPLGLLAREGEREIEVFFPDGIEPPATGHITDADASTIPISLRETAGAADAASRTWRTRYQIDAGEAAQSLPLGSVVRVNLGGDTMADTLTIPIAALDERGDGAQIWRIVEGRAQPLAVSVESLDMESARVRAELEDGSRIISLGTHLLKPGMEVRELAQ